MFINPFSTIVPFLYSLRASENRRFSDVFSGCRSGTLVENGLIYFAFKAGKIIGMLWDVDPIGHIRVWFYLV